jgi:hypothetical protein
LDQIATATEIRVVEHSNREDEIRELAQTSTNWTLDPHWKETIYKTVVLDEKQKLDLRDSMPWSLDLSGPMITIKACAFDSHHRVEIQQADGSVLRMEVCFVCGQMALNNENQRDLPAGWREGFSAFVASLSLHPDGPWSPSAGN